MRTTKRIRTVLYGDQKLSAAELEVIHTPAMQRLYGLHQLGLTDRVFVDASHARIHHVVGVLHQVDQLVSAIVRNLRRSSSELQMSTGDGKTRTVSAKSIARYVRNRKSVVRFIGLLHDLTHAPFGHTIEDEIQLVNTKHDHPERQAEAFYRLLCQLVAWLALDAYGPDWAHLPEPLKPFLSQGGTAPLPDPSVVGTTARELLSGLQAAGDKAELCLKLTPKYMAEMFAHLACAMTALLHLELLHAKELTDEIVPNDHGYMFQKAIQIALENSAFAPLLVDFRFDPHRDAFMLDIVGNTVCADLLDYAARDSHYAGLRLDYDPARIAENFTLISVETNSEHRGAANRTLGRNGQGPHALRNAFRGWCLRTAISLVSHKLRTDVPSELMNLLNVRFYLYERVIFHSTKCAAGSMLGTALQLLGWRSSNTGDRQPRLPKHLEFVGDEVFLHDIHAALSFLIDAVSKIPEEQRIDEILINGLSDLERVHNGLVHELLRLRSGQSAGQALMELCAGRLLLDRLMARRYFRPVFRALPNSAQKKLLLGAADLAELFIRPDLRYETERKIEIKAQLPPGTITIHCPRRNTAEKIANVLLTKPASGNATDPHCTLRTIGKLDPETFGEHERAVRAVEDMYKSMWRLTVYVAPEHMERWKEIGEAAGQAIFEIADREHGSRFPDQPQTWENDPDLVRELEAKADRTSVIQGSDADLSQFGEDLGRVVDRLVSSGRLGPISSALYDSEDGLTVEGTKLIERALASVINGDGALTARAAGSREAIARADSVLGIIETYVRSNGAQVLRFKGAYATRLDRLEPKEFGLIESKLKAAIEEETVIDGVATDHRGTSFDQCMELLGMLLDELEHPTTSLFRDNGK